MDLLILLKIVLIPGKYVKIREQKMCIPWGQCNKMENFWKLEGVYSKIEWKSRCQI